jgi:hypothetical protein
LSSGEVSTRESLAVSTRETAYRNFLEPFVHFYCPTQLCIHVCINANERERERKREGERGGRERERKRERERERERELLCHLVNFYV